MAQITIFTKVPCPFCERAKRFLEEKGLPYEEIDLTNKEDEIQKIKDQYNWRTVPIILINGKCIGGYSDMKTLDETGKFNELL